MTAWTRDRKIEAARQAPRMRALLRPDSRVIMRFADPAEGGDATRRPKWMSLVTPSATTYLNEITFAQLEEDECERVIDETVATYRELGIRTKWSVGPDSAPADLGERLLRRGFTHDGYRAMGIDTSARIEAPLDVRVEAVDESNVDEYVRVGLEGWSMPPGQAALDRKMQLDALSANPCIVQLFLARIDGEAIGTAATILRDDAYGYLIGGQVLARARLRGAYRALTSSRLDALRARGFEYAVTYANEKTSAPALERMGFEYLFSSATYTLAP